ncbi:ABC transporter ATP-binding protein [Metabacillus litoralis]|uniref:ABC transporter ATP-binding protein n=1 Tax=Metabacillus litoralis TaxID=152268 RepID=UPI001CFEAD4C|nr:ABC transporter ATP-binding protein [Metabacillus litoralis]
MLEIKNLTKTIENNKILNEINLKLEPGEIFGLLGRNGSGKTTLLRCIQQILRVDSGEILFENVSISDHPLIKRKVIYMPVQNPAFDRYTYKQLVRMLRTIYPDFDVTYANELVNRYDLPENKKYRELSTGLKKQLSLILSFSIRPAVIMLDEPTDGIDAVTRHDLLQLMIDEVANKGTTILITSHRLEDIERICNRIAFLEQNQMSGVLEVEDLKESYMKVQLAYDNDVDLQIRKRGIPILESTGVFYTVIIKRDDEDSQEFLNLLAPRIWNELPVSLEEVFIAKFGGKRRW